MNVNFKAEQTPFRLATAGAPYQQNPVGVETQQPPKPQNRPNIIVLPMDRFDSQATQAKKKSRKDEFYKIMGLVTSLALTVLIAISLKPMWEGTFKKAKPEDLFTPIKDDVLKLSELPGMKEVKELFKKKVINPSKYPELFEKEGIQPGMMMLLTGPPGVGKTNFVLSAAKETGAKIMTIKASEEGSKWVHGTSGNIASKVKIAKNYCNNNPQEEVFLLIDELESLGGKFSNDQKHDMEVTKTLLQVLDDIKGTKNLRVFATTNELVNPVTGRVGNIDEALANRMEVLHIDKPDHEARKAALELFFKKFPSAKSFVENNDLLEEFAYRTEGFVYRDLVRIKDRAIESLMNAKITAKEAGNNPDEVILTREIVMDALKKFGKNHNNGRIFTDDIPEFLNSETINSLNRVTAEAKKTTVFHKIKNFFTRNSKTTEV